MALFKSKTVSTAIISAILPAVLGGMLAGCNKKEEKPAAPATQAPAQAEATAPIIVTGNDQMQFSTKTIEVKAGSEVVVIFQNVGTMAKEVMGHNLTILNPGTDLAGFASKAMTAKDTEYQPQSEAASVFAHTRLLGPGESDTLRFTPAAGEYPYLCTFPGHFAVMQGVLSAK